MTNEYKGVLIFAEQKNNTIHPVAYELLNKGGQLADTLGVDIMAVVLGPEEIDTRELIERGAKKVYHIVHETVFSYPEEIVYADNISALIDDIRPEICLFGATNFGRSLAPRVAALQQCGLTADCTDLQIDEEDQHLIQIRPAFSENILAHIKSKARPQMATIRYQEFDAAKRDESNEGEVIKVEGFALENPQVEVIEKLQTEEFDISKYDVVVSGGVGVKTPEDMKLIQELADLLGGCVGASRPAVEEGYCTKAHQVGYSGNRVKPTLYIAAGISGAPQHLTGMKESDTIIAINSDVSAPIFSAADIGIVGDLYQVLPEMIKRVKKLQGGE